MHLDCHLVWPLGLGRASRRLAALSDMGWEGARRGTRSRGRTQKVAAGGREAERVEGSEHPSAQRKEGALHQSEGAICALSGNVPARGFPR